MKEDFEQNAMHELLELGSKRVSEMIELEVRSPRFGVSSNYLIKEIAKDFWLVEGKGPPVSWSEKELNKIRDIDLALSFARTAEEPLLWNGKEIKKIVPDRAIIQWAKLYGLPKAEVLPRGKPQHVELERMGCLVREFRKHAASFYFMFLLWRELDHPSVEDSLILGDKIIRQLLERLLLFGNMPLQSLLIDAPDETGLSQTIECERKLDIQQALPAAGEALRAIAKHTLGSFIRYNTEGNLSLEYHPKSQKFGLIAKDLYTVGYIQFAALLIQPKASREKYLKKCDYCHKYFWGSGWAKYCPHHDRRTVWSRRHKQGEGGESTPT